MKGNYRYLLRTVDHRAMGQVGAFIFCLVFVALPLALPSIPPLIDLPGHLGRYEVQLHLATSPYLHQWFDFKWVLSGNLGVDIIVQIFAHQFGIEPTVKAVVTIIPVITTIGLIWIAREVHGKVLSTTILSIPLVYNYSFQYGFVNFCLSMAFALVGFALWLHLSNKQKFGWRFGAFLIISPIVWITHVMGWGALCLICASAEFAREFEQGNVARRGWIRSIWKVGLACFSLALPLLLLVVWRGDGSSMGMEQWPAMALKAKWAVMLLRDRWLVYDVLSALAIYSVIAIGLFYWRLGTVSLALGSAGIILAITAIIMPGVMFGSWFAGPRLIPYSIMLLLVAIRPSQIFSVKHQNLLMIFAVAFFIVRVTTTVVSFIIYSEEFDVELKAVNHIEEGSRVAGFVGHDCGIKWGSPRFDLIQNIVILRRSSFTNGEWANAGSQSLKVHYYAAKPFLSAPSQMVTSQVCSGPNYSTITENLRILPYDAFDYIWLINISSERWPNQSRLKKIWQSRRSVLYKVTKPTKNT